MARLAKKITVIGVVVVAVIGIVASLQMSGMGALEESPEAVEPEVVVADVIMPTKVSRPGCEETDSCYIPTKITVKAGQQVTWLNQDSAFHSVTSGRYDSPTDDFDSGYMDPYQSFTLTFDQIGTIDYFCTLHPWMEGQVIVES